MGTAFVWFKSWFKGQLLRRKAIISRPPGQFSIVHYKLRQAKARGLDVKCAVDGGAAEGGWAIDIKDIYPQASVLCIEPRDGVQPVLREAAKRLGGVKVAQVLLGAREGTAKFHEQGMQSSMLGDSEGKAFGTVAEHPVTTLDQLVKKELLDAGLGWPELIKLDLQGAELLALEGGAECLAHAQAVLLEVSFMAFQEGNPVLADVVEFMRRRAFQCYDVLGLWHRSLDGALAQGDLLFIREDHPLVSDRRWSRETGVATS